MKISYNWLKDYIDLGEMSANEAADILTDIGLEVEGVEHFRGPGNGLEGLVVGQVRSVSKHPDADRLQVTTVDVGAGDPLQIVCGAPNVAEGQKVVVATVGTTLYPEKGDAFQIKKAKIRGVESSGMICAEDEIGLGESHDGIMVLPENVAIGTTAKEYFQVKEDYILEIGLTPNRADAMGHIGVARDLQAAIAVRQDKDIRFKYPEVKAIKLEGEQLLIEVVVENTEACPRYSGVMMRGAKVGESPAWLQQRLQSVGLRPINNIVDITNYILLEYGQPLHAFDAAAIKGNKVVVKNLPAGSTFVTLDENERKLDAADLMICNSEEGMCIAGVFGGLHSGVKETTTNIFIESAYFNPVSIRKTSGRHNLRTDAAIRFEKGTDPNITIAALSRAVAMIEELAGGKVASEVIDVYPNPVPDHTAELSYANLDRLVGHKIERPLVKTALQRLGIKITKETEESLQLAVPPFKVDVQREVDVIEEVLRIYGFNQIPFPTQFHASLSYSAHPDKEKIQNKVSDFLSANGFFELMTNSIIDSAYYDTVLSGDKDHRVELQTSSNAGLNTLRTDMVVTGLEALAYNLNRRNSDLKFFDFGRTYRKAGENKFEEQEHLAMYVTGQQQPESWTAKEQAADFYFIKSFVNGLLQRLGLSNCQITEAKDTRFELNMTYTLGNKQIVTFGKLDKSFLKEADIKQAVFFADFNWQNVIASLSDKRVKFEEISKFPGTRRDLALLLDSAETFGKIEAIALKEGGSLLRSVNLFDVYEDKKLGQNKKSYAVSFFFEDDSKTLKDEEIDKLMDRFIRRYKDELKAEIR